MTTDQPLLVVASDRDETNEYNVRIMYVREYAYTVFTRSHSVVWWLIMGSIKNSVATRRLPGYTSYKLMIDSDGNNQQLVYVPVNHISYLSTTQNVKNRI